MTTNILTIEEVLRNIRAKHTDSVKADDAPSFLEWLFAHIESHEQEHTNNGNASASI